MDTMRERLIRAAVNAPRAVGHEHHMASVVDTILAELREPDEAMVRVAESLLDWGDQTPGPFVPVATPERAFTAMIDAIREKAPDA